MTVLLAVEALGVDYTPGRAGGVAFAEVSLTMEKGERLAVIGESGSGKSTLAFCIAGLLPRSAHVSGRIGWPGLRHPARNGADIGFVFQDSNGTLDPVMTVGRQVAEVAGANLGLDPRAARRQAIALLDRVRLPDPAAIFDAYPHQLSGGQRQRVGIAAAIAGKPALLIADEPTSALDTIVQAEIMGLLDEIVRETGMSLLLISHDIALAARHSERMAVMRQGCIVELGTTREIILSPRSVYAKSLVALAGASGMQPVLRAS